MIVAGRHIRARCIPLARITRSTLDRLAGAEESTTAFVYSRHRVCSVLNSHDKRVSSSLCACEMLHAAVSPRLSSGEPKIPRTSRARCGFGAALQLGSACSGNPALGALDSAIFQRSFRACMGEDGRTVTKNSSIGGTDAAREAPSAHMRMLTTPCAALCSFRSAQASRTI